MGNGYLHFGLTESRMKLEMPNLSRTLNQELNQIEKIKSGNQYEL
jgi:hypothetical protein